MNSRSPRRRLLTATSLALAASPALACSVCGCGDPLVGVGQVAGPAGQLGLELDGQWLSQKAGGDVPDTTDVLNQYSVLLTASYTPVANLNLVVTLPWVWKDMQMEMPDGTRMTSSNLNGFGDMQFGLRWFFWDDTRRRQPHPPHAVGLGLDLRPHREQLGGPTRTGIRDRRARPDRDRRLGAERRPLLPDPGRRLERLRRRLGALPQRQLLRLPLRLGRALDGGRSVPAARLAGRGARRGRARRGVRRAGRRRRGEHRRPRAGRGPGRLREGVPRRLAARQGTAPLRDPA